jgi:uncharacterized membrane protein
MLATWLGQIGTEMIFSYIAPPFEDTAVILMSPLSFMLTGLLLAPSHKPLVAYLLAAATLSVMAYRVSLAILYQPTIPLDAALMMAAVILEVFLIVYLYRKKQSHQPGDANQGAESTDEANEGDPSLALKALLGSLTIIAVGTGFLAALIVLLSIMLMGPF